MLSSENMQKAREWYKQAKTDKDREAVRIALSAQESLNNHFYPKLPQVPDFLKPYIPQP